MKTPDGIITEFDLTCCEDQPPELAVFAHKMHLSGMTSGIHMMAQALQESIEEAISLDDENFKQAFVRAHLRRFAIINEQLKARFKK